MNNLVSLPSSIYKFKGLVKLDVSECSKLESLPEEIGDLEKLEYLNARYTLISRPPSSIVWLNKLKLLSFGKKKTEDGVYFVFPRVNEGLFSLEALNLSNCNLIDGGLPEDIGSLSSLKTLDLAGNNFEYLPQSIAQLSGLRSLDLSYCTKLKELTDFTGMPNLEYLDLEECKSLEEVHHSLGCSRKLIDLKLYNCESLKRFPYVNAESLEYLDLNYCSSLEKFPEILGRMKLELEITMSYSGIREVPLSIIHLLSHLTVLDWSGMNNLVSLPSSICKFKGLVKLDVSECSKLENLPEEIGDLEKLEELYGSYTQISRPPSSIVRLNKLTFLTFAKEKRGSKDGVYFVFAQVSEGLRSLEKLDLSYCNLIDGGLPEDIGCLSSLKELYLEENNFEHLPRSIAQLSGLQSLDLSDCKRLKELPNFMGMPNLETLVLSSCNLIDGGLPEDIGCLSSLKELDLSGNNFEYLPQSIAQLSGLQSLSLSDCKRLKELPGFMGMPNLETLELSSCNLIDGGLPEDIGSLSSLKKLGLAGNNFEHLPQSIAQLSDLQSLYLSDCKRLTQLPEIPQQLDTIDADWSNDSICNSLFQNISSLQHDISASESLSLRVFTSWLMNIPSWFHHQGVGTSVSVDLPENWYVSDKFLGFAVCYSGKLIDITALLIPLCDDGMSSMTQKLALSNHSKTPVDSSIHFFLVPLAGLWDASNANGKTPNDYGCIGLYSPGEMKEFGVRLLYKDEPEICIGIRRNKYEEASCSSAKKQVHVPLSSKTTKIHSFIRRLAKPMKGTCFLRR